MLSPELPNFSAELAAKQRLAFPILQDRSLAIAKEYGLVYTFPDDLKNVFLKLKLDLAQRNGESSWQLPMPARFVIDRTGVIRYAEANPDYTVRPEPEETIAVLKTLV